ncbi:MAG TPA: hypothetical protein PLD01_16550, partial [Mycobacterium sp.]|nr:hypothetical protein [Mycobacterium sp.]
MDGIPGPEIAHLAPTIASEDGRGDIEGLAVLACDTDQCLPMAQATIRPHSEHVPDELALPTSQRHQVARPATDGVLRDPAERVDEVRSLGAAGTSQRRRGRRRQPSWRPTSNPGHDPLRRRAISSSILLTRFTSA